MGDELEASKNWQINWCTFAATAIENQMKNPSKSAVSTNKSTDANLADFRGGPAEWDWESHWRNFAK
jgi:hypothetical protein